MVTSTNLALRPARRKLHIVFRPGRIVLYIVLIAGSLVMLYPLVVMVMGSVGSNADYIRSPSFPIPYHFSLAYYTTIMTPGTTIGQMANGSFSSGTSSQADFPRLVLNTLIRIAWYMLITGYTSVVGGYALSKLRWKGREASFTYMLSSMVLPGIVYLIPTYVMMARMPLAGGNNIAGQGGHGLIDQWPALLITGWVNVYYIFMFRQTMGSIPNDFEEAALVDGAGTGQILFKIYLPMLKPVFVVLFINTFVALWNDYIWPLMAVAGNRDIMPIALGFQFLAMNVTAQAHMPPDLPPFGFQFTVGVLSITPCILLFLFLQRYFVEGVQGFAIKG
jgi:multiple sugar transport system permease protein